MIAALFVRADSFYRDLGVDCWDVRRDARGYVGPGPVIAHPPCRTWASLRHFSKAPPGEHELGLFAMACVRRFGGVLEHPSRSLLWRESGITPFGRDRFGGYLFHVWQSWWGHRAPKSTGLYFVGVEPSDLPAIPFVLGSPAGRIEFMGKAERERTPPLLASWLVGVASRVLL